MILSATNEANTIAIEGMLENLFKELFAQTLNGIETAASHPNSLKNQNEILRCFTQLGSSHVRKQNAPIFSNLNFYSNFKSQTVLRQTTTFCSSKIRAKQRKNSNHFTRHPQTFDQLGHRAHVQQKGTCLVGPTHSYRRSEQQDQASAHSDDNINGLSWLFAIGRWQRHDRIYFETVCFSKRRPGSGQ